MVFVNDIKKKYRKLTVLNGISFTVSPGDCIAILGENGCGKSTLLAIMSGTIAPDSGEIVYKEGSRIGYVPQDNPLIPELSVKDNLRLWYGKSIPPLVNSFGLTEFLKKPVQKLSGGMKKRLSIVIAMADNPDILILDEPSAALDLPCKQMIREYLENYTKGGGTVIIATHDEMELEICNRALVINDGVCNPISPDIRGHELITLLSGKPKTGGEPT